MEINEFLKLHFVQLTQKNISYDNEFLTYENFKRFIHNHYSLAHMEKHNYIKYVKVKRQILLVKDKIRYSSCIKEINDLVKVMNEYNTFPCIDIRKYMFKIYNVFKLIEDRKENFLKTIKTIHDLYDLKGDSDFKIKILIGINTLNHRYQTLVRNSKKLVHLINKFIELEMSNGIDHKMIELNNIERTFLGKKSEYTVNKLIMDYIEEMNNKGSDIKYFYEHNIDLIKLLDIKASHNDTIKGEVDGVIISQNANNEYTIEKIIEVKSSIKATFDDIPKFLFLEKHIALMDNESEVKYGNYIFKKDSFKNIIGHHLTNWVTYISVNNVEHDYIEKSHLYFSTVLKIIDDNFIKDYYIDNCENAIREKYEIIINSREIIDRLFKEWTDNIKLDKPECNLFITKS